MTEAISVSKLNTYIKQIFDAEELLHNIPVVGEVFGVNFSRNVIYFSLKDEQASLSCVCFYPNFSDQIVEGAKIVAVGSPNFYVKGGKLNFNVVRIEKVGQGKLYEDFLKLKQKLQEEGLFDQSHKKAMPKSIQRIGVITSRDGAVIQDIKNVCWRRNPSVDIVLFNTKVQGNLAEKEIAEAIHILGNYEKVDVIIVARGGGSLEDLWAYNTEIVARAAFDCPKPIISAVGHETDFTIIDFVSDMRAPTPSAAAELLTYNIADKKGELELNINRFIKAYNTFLSGKTAVMHGHSLALTNGFERLFNRNCHMLERNRGNLQTVYESYLQQKYYELGLFENTLGKINPISILSKGFAKIEQNGKGIVSKEELDVNNTIEIIFRDGRIVAQPLDNKE